MRERGGVSCILGTTITSQISDFPLPVSSQYFHSRILPYLLALVTKVILSDIPDNISSILIIGAFSIFCNAIQCSVHSCFFFTTHSVDPDVHINKFTFVFHQHGGPINLVPVQVDFLYIQRRLFLACGCSRCIRSTTHNLADGVSTFAAHKQYFNDNIPTFKKF